MGAGEDAGRHLGSLQAGTDIHSAYTSRHFVMDFMSGQHEERRGETGEKEEEKRMRRGKRPGNRAS